MSKIIKTGDQYLEQFIEKRLAGMSFEVAMADLKLTEDQKLTVFNMWLNMEPKESWLADHPTAKKNGKPIKYLPIERVEFLLTSIFQHWHVEVNNIQVIANSVVVTVTLYVKNVFKGEDFMYQMGAGAMPIHTEKGAGATDFTKVLTDSVMKAVPGAESYAIKDAAEKFGKIFGKDLNRDSMLDYTSLMTERRQDREDKRKEFSNLMAQCQDTELIAKYTNRAIEAENNLTDDAEFYQNLIDGFNKETGSKK